MMYHVMCYSKDFKEKFIGTNQKSLDGDLFGRLKRFFGVPMQKAVVVEHSRTLFNPETQHYSQLELFTTEGV